VIAFPYLLGALPDLIFRGLSHGAS
jgi:hypothetical protein